ncbi:hypothetical protein VDG1235_4720 [Verrucomicrobiia bacterium DG1235]|nr:hypothetical protein VDG1235_4720 [Verrucomicrobiae bacterium DG1235]
MRRVKAKRLFVCVVAGLGLLLSGCETVQPWEKGNLADYTMKADRDSLEGVMTAHVYFSREASTGGEGVGGGGCGCN